jgi:hypothetical protein
MKKIIILILMNCVITPLYGMRAQFGLDQGRLSIIKKAYADYITATKKLDQKAIAQATQEIKEARDNTPLWQRLIGYSHLTAAQRYEVHYVFSDSLLLRYFESRIDCLPWQEKQDREKELSALRDTIMENLGQGAYIAARKAYWQLLSSVQECDPAKTADAVTAVKKARAQFSWPQKLGLFYFTAEGNYPYYDYKERITSDEALAREVLDKLSYCTDVARAQELISSQDRNFPLRVLATRESHRTDGFAGNKFQNAVVLEAFYKLRTPLNSAQLLEYAKKHNNDAVQKVIYDYNPDLKN